MTPDMLLLLPSAGGRQSWHDVVLSPSLLIFGEDFHLKSCGRMSAVHLQFVLILGPAFFSIICISHKDLLSACLISTSGSLHLLSPPRPHFHRSSNSWLLPLVPSLMKCNSLSWPCYTHLTQPVNCCLTLLYFLCSIYHLLNFFHFITC